MKSKTTLKILVAGFLLTYSNFNTNAQITNMPGISEENKANFKTIEQINKANKNKIGGISRRSNVRQIGYKAQEHDGAQFNNASDSISFHWIANRGGGFSYFDYMGFTLFPEDLSPAEQIKYYIFKIDTAYSYPVNSSHTYDPPRYKIIGNADAFGNIISQLEQEWVASAWANDRRNNYAYNSAGLVTERSEENWDGSTWNYSYKIMYTYDANGNLTEALEQDWQNSTSSWINYSKDVYEYNANNKITVRIQQNWNTSSWQNSYKQIHEYNSAGQKTRVIDQNGSGGTSWVNSYRSSFNYTGNNNTEIVYENWETSSSSWKPNNRSLLTYDANNLCTTFIRQNWISGAWSNSSQTLVTYNSFDEADTYIFQDWNASSSTFVNEDKYEFEYFNNYDLVSIVTSYSWNVGGFWENIINNVKYFNYYEEFEGTNIKPSKNTLSIALYPNPTSSMLHFEVKDELIKQVIISDINGKVLIVQNGKEKAINVAHLAPGNYTISIQGQKEYGTKMFSILK